MLHLQGPNERKMPGFEKKGAQMQKLQFDAVETCIHRPLKLATCPAECCMLRAGMWKEIERSRE